MLAGVTVRRLVLLGLLGACVSERPRVSPDPDLKAAMDWRNASPVNRAIDRFIMGGTFLWGAWQRSGPVTVVEDGVASTWQAAAFETQNTGVKQPGPCWASGHLSIQAWRPLEDSSGIETIFIILSQPFDLDGSTLGARAECPRSSGSWPPGFVMGQRREGRHESLVAVAGQVHLGVIGGPNGHGCVTVSGQPASFECISVGLTARATLASLGAHGDTGTARRSIVIGPAAIPGIRQYFPCGEPSRCQPQSLPLPQTTGYGPMVGTRAIGSWRGDSVYRNFVHLRLQPNTPDSAAEALLARWAAIAIGRGPAGDIRVKIPDPGPGPGAIDRMLQRLAGDPVVGWVLPIRAKELLTAAAPGRLEVTLIPPPVGGPATHVCFGALITTPNWLQSPWCRSVEGNFASFEQAPVSDYHLFAICSPDASSVTFPIDSLPVQISPATTTHVTIRPRKGC